MNACAVSGVLVLMVGLAAVLFAFGAFAWALFRSEPPYDDGNCP